MLKNNNRVSILFTAIVIVLALYVSSLATPTPTPTPTATPTPQVCEKKIAVYQGWKVIGGVPIMGQGYLYVKTTNGNKYAIAGYNILWTNPKDVVTNWIEPPEKMDLSPDTAFGYIDPTTGGSNFSSRKHSRLDK